MATVIDRFMQQQLLDRRHRLEHGIQHGDVAGRLHSLLEEVDSALARIDHGAYGICEACHDTIECDRLIADPLIRFCLDHLSRPEKDALERDLELAARVQRGLLPRQNLDRDGWRICYYYEPAGLVSGDYCDVIDAGEAGLYFMVGDVSGKGVAASMLMSHLHAMFRTLISVGLSLKCMIDHASRVFSESTLPNQYATLVCGRALPNGGVEICNAGHPFPLVVNGEDIRPFEVSHLPIGMFGSEDFTVSEISLEPGQSLVMYSDGVSEAQDASGEEYGVERLRHQISRQRVFSPSGMLAACREDLTRFRNSAPKTDDLTLFVLGREGVHEATGPRQQPALSLSLST
jgi:sigma-B regulation protein RsbU (phosphoserine phosphatase)